jgi:hypothetical protein
LNPKAARSENLMIANLRIKSFKGIFEAEADIKQQKLGLKLFAKKLK